MKKDAREKKEARVEEWLLGEDFARDIVAEFNLGALSSDAQAEFISELGLLVTQRLVLEISKALPESEREKFNEFIGSGDMDGLKAFLLPHIPDLDRFVQAEAMKEFEATKTRMREIQQGV